MTGAGSSRNFSVIVDGGASVYSVLGVIKEYVRLSGYGAATNARLDILYGQFNLNQFVESEGDEFQTDFNFTTPIATTILKLPAKPIDGTYTLATLSDFKTVNGESVVGSGDIVISGGGGVASVTGTAVDNADPLNPGWLLKYKTGKLHVVIHY
jgi:hypothetical protein